MATFDLRLSVVSRALLSAGAVFVLAACGGGESPSSDPDNCVGGICLCVDTTDCAAGETCINGVCGSATPDAGADVGTEDTTPTPDTGTDATVDVAPDTADVTEEVTDDVTDDTDDATDTEIVEDVTPDVEDTTPDTTDVIEDTADVTPDVEEDVEPPGPFPVVIENVRNALIAFSMEPSDPPGLQQVFTVESAGTNPRQLFTSAEYLSTFAPSFSPDGDRLACVAFTNGGLRVLLIVDLATGTVDEISPAGLVQFEQISWSPVGEWIVLQATAEGDPDNELYLIDLEAADPGAERVKLTDNDRGDTFPRWANDGRVFYISSLEGSDVLDIFALDPFADDLTPVQQTTGADPRGKFGISANGDVAVYSVSLSGQVQLRQAVLPNGEVTQLATGLSEGDPYGARWESGPFLVTTGRFGGVVIGELVPGTGLYGRTIYAPTGTPLTPVYSQVDASAITLGLGSPVSAD
jgi:hypothetical protein